MCDPITLTSLALTAASTVAHSAAQSRVNAARDAAMRTEQARQAGYDKQALDLNNQTKDQFGNIATDQNKAAEGLGDYFKAAVPQPTSAGAANTAAATQMPAASNDVVAREADKQGRLATNYTDQQAGALGNLRSFGDAFGDASRTQGLNAALIGQLGGFKDASSNVLGYELEDANQKGNGMNLLGDILGGAAGVVGPLGAAGKLPFLTGAAKPLSAISGSAGAMTRAGTVIKPTAFQTGGVGSLY